MLQVEDPVVNPPHRGVPPFVIEHVRSELCQGYLDRISRTVEQVGVRISYEEDQQSGNEVTNLSRCPLPDALGNPVGDEGRQGQWLCPAGVPTSTLLLMA